jgi:hypothetical protein
MVYRLDAGTVIDADGNLVIENLYASSVAQQYSFQGSTSGYTSGGAPTLPSINNIVSNTIDKFPFAADANATDVGDLTLSTNSSAGSHSMENGYVSGGTAPTDFPTRITNTIQKFPFSVDTNSTDIADLTEAKHLFAGHSSDANGYTSGGSENTTVATPPANQYNTIEKFPFSADANATDVGDLTQVRRSSSGTSSETHGYTAGGNLFPESPGTTPITIDRFPFSSDENSSDVGDLYAGAGLSSGQSSTTHGYASGQGPPYFSNIIQKYSFSSSANSSDVGDLTAGRSIQAGQSSTNHGYVSGGQIPPSPSPDVRDIIDKFSFSVDANATDVGDLTQARVSATGTEI